MEEINTLPRSLCQRRFITFFNDSNIVRPTFEISFQRIYLFGMRWIGQQIQAHVE